MSTCTKPSLQPWKNITALSEPLVSPGPSSKHILVIGGGVIGLTTSWALLDHGYRVTIVSKEWASFTDKQRLASQIAGALWEYPPAVCGQHTDKISLQHSKKWCMVAYHIWDAIASDEELSRSSGVRMLPSDFYFPHLLDFDPFQLNKMNEIKSSGVRGFRSGPHLISERRVDSDHGGVDAYEILAPVIDTDAAMAWLMKLVLAKGAVMHTETIRGDLLTQEHYLRARFEADVIVNCTGLAGAEVAGDKSCYPIRGGLLRVVNDGKDFPKVEAALTISANVAKHNEIVFIVPRNDDILLLGGFTEPHEWNLDLTLDSPVMKRMRARCEEFLPELKEAHLDPEYPMAQGLRPFRGTNIRVERELRTLATGRPPSRIVHSYGHGGAGWSLSFGCAGDVLSLVEEALMDLPPKSTTSEHRNLNAQHAIQARM
ncbi:hypothetical protein V5O48_009086 [Marasmius crinis-equi]|uniref:FAD dependent oxidoreductase domain-containing protein n=1 Tax=Marasmius crinis-equi TaxID=585013 RepID=A0ABR3FCR3_9AGAR